MSSSSSVVSNPVEPETNSVAAAQEFGNSSGDCRMEGGVSEKSMGVIGILEVYIHQARDIHNVCIYHKQDVYAKISLTDDLETTVSTQTVNGGGRNPVFNQNLRLDVRSIESSLKCEVWMLSRVRNYLQDQLLGFALVPLTDVVIENGKLEKEFTLSANDIFHSPSGFIQLSLAYSGASPEVLEISPPRPSLVVNEDAQDKEGLSSVPAEFGMIEFLDPKIVNENEMMVTEYFGIPCADLVHPDSQHPNSLDNTNDDTPLNAEVDAPMVEFFDAPETEMCIAQTNGATEVSKTKTLSVDVSTNESPSISVLTNSSSDCKNTGASKSDKQNVVPDKEKTQDAGETPISSVINEKMQDAGQAPISTVINEKTQDAGETPFSAVIEEKKQDAAEAPISTVIKEKTLDAGENPISTVTKPLISLNVEAEQKVVQQDYVDMYMKSMQQFTEALSKMKLPLDNGTELAVRKEKDSNEKAQASKESGPSPRVFYGSRAFF